MKPSLNSIHLENSHDISLTDGLRIENVSISKRLPTNGSAYRVLSFRLSSNEKSEDLSFREGYQNPKKVWEKYEISLLSIDEFSRWGDIEINPL